MHRFHEFIFVICFILLGFEWRVVAQNCNNQTVQLCLSYLTKKGLDMKHFDDDLPTWNETDSMLRYRCTAADEFSRCMVDEIDQCSSKEHALYSGWTEAYKFLCKQSNLTTVAEYLQCYASDPVNRTAEGFCRNNFRSKVSILTNGTSTINSDKLADYCKLVSTFFECLNETVTDNCGEDAATWYWTWDQKLNGVVVSSCGGSDSNGGSSSGATSGWTVALIAVLVLITVIMITAIAFLVVFLFRKKKERSRIQQVRRRMHAAAPPPPYSAVLYSSSEPGAEPQAHLVDSSVVIRPGGQEGGQEEPAVHPPTDVFLPPPYMGERSPAPIYEDIQAAETNAAEGHKTEGEEAKQDDGKKEEEEEKKKEETKKETDSEPSSNSQN